MHTHTDLSLILAALILLVTGLPLGSAISQGQQAIEVQTNQAQIEFPDQISFQLEITSSSPIETIELEYGVEKVSCGQMSARIEPEITARSQHRRVQATWTWELYRSGSLPPGAQVWWRWHIAAEAGESLTTPRAWISFDDDRYDWKTLTEGQITVQWYAGDETFGQQMLQTALEAQALLTADPEADLERPVHFYIYANSGDLKGALIFPQRWTGGIAFTDFYTVLIGAGPQNQAYGQTVIAHELMHLLVHQLAFNCWSSLPTWLDEGLAGWAEGDPSAAQQHTLDEAIARNGLFSLRQLGGSFPTHSDRAHLAYAQSQSVVVYLVDACGREKIVDLLTVFRDGATHDGALEQVYGFDIDGLDDLWRASIGAQPRAAVLAPGGSPTPVPTLSLWTGEPASSSSSAVAMATATLTLLPSPRPSATSGPSSTQVVIAVSPTALVYRTPSSSNAPVFAPTPIGGRAKQAGTSHWLWYGAGIGVLVVLVILAFAYTCRDRKLDVLGKTKE